MISLPTFFNITRKHKNVNHQHNAGQAVVQIIGNDSKLKKVLNDAGAGIQGFAQKWTAIGSRLQAAGQMMSAPFQEAMRVFAQFFSKASHRVTTAAIDMFFHPFFI